MTTSVDTSIASLSIRLAEPVIPPTLRDFNETFEDLESLIFVGSILGTVRADLDRLADARPKRLLMVAPEVLTASQNVAESFRVVRMTYRSPIEILMQSGGVYGHVVAIGSAVYLSVRGVLSLWGLACDTKKKHVDTKLAASDAAMAMAINERLRTTFPITATGSNLDRGNLNETQRRALLGKPLNERLQGASKILTKAEEIAVVET